MSAQSKMSKRLLKNYVKRVYNTRQRVRTVNNHRRNLLNREIERVVEERKTPLWVNDAVDLSSFQPATNEFVERSNKLLADNDVTKPTGETVLYRKIKSLASARKVVRNALKMQSNAVKVVLSLTTIVGKFVEGPAEPFSAAGGVHSAIVALDDRFVKLQAIIADGSGGVKLTYQTRREVDDAGRDFVSRQHVFTPMMVHNKRTMDCRVVISLSTLVAREWLRLCRVTQFTLNLTCIYRRH